MTNAQEDKIYEAQQRYIDRRFGKKASVNLGWVVDETVICTKVYGHGILNSWYARKKIIHQFTEFEEEDRGENSGTDQRPDKPTGDGVLAAGKTNRQGTKGRKRKTDGRSTK